MPASSQNIPLLERLRSFVFGSTQSARQSRDDSNFQYVSITPVVRKPVLPIPYPSRSAAARRISIAEHETLRETSETLTGCGLFSKLPSELRDMIWREAIDDKVVHVWLENRRLKGFVCSQSIKEVVEKNCFMKCWAEEFDGDARIGVWGVIGSCRQLYTELIDRLYAKTTFNFHDRQSLGYLPMLIPFERLQSITSLYSKLSLIYPPSYDSTASHRYTPEQVAAIRASGRDGYVEVWFRIWETLATMGALTNAVIHLQIGICWNLQDLDVVQRLQSGGKVVLVMPRETAFHLKTQMGEGEEAALNYCIRSPEP